MRFTCPQCGYVAPHRTRHKNRDAEIVADYERTKSGSETARNFHISRQYVHQILKAHGVSSNEGRQARVRNTDEKVASAHSRGLHNAGIAETTGISILTVRVSMARQGLTPNKYAKPISNRVQNVIQMFDNGASSSEIARNLGYPNSETVTAILWRHGRRVCDRNQGKS